MIRTVTDLELDEMDDLMISFLLDEEGTRSVTVVRAGDFDHLPIEQRPKPRLFTHEEPQPADDLLVAAEWDQQRVHLKSLHREFTLDVSRVDSPDALTIAKRILRHMNYDKSFDLMIRRGKKT